MSARAPAAIWAVWNAIHEALPTALLGGIVGDVNHSFGYHLARRDLPSTDYSVQLPMDKQGAADCASALDVSLPPDLMVACTKRLIAAAKQADPRLRALREFCGTTNGQTPHPFDLSRGFDDPNNTEGWDSSHVSHVHLSFYREFADDTAALAPIAEVFTGEEAMPSAEEIAKAVWDQPLSDGDRSQPASSWVKQARNLSDPKRVAALLIKQLPAGSGVSQADLEKAFANVLREGVGQ